MFVLTVGFFQTKDMGIIKRLAAKHYMRLILPVLAAVVSRSVGFTAHYLDQRRHDEGLFKLPNSEVSYIPPEEV